MISEVNVIKLLLYNTEYRKKAFSRLNENVFHDKNCEKIFSLLKNYNQKYDKFVDDVKILIMNNVYGDEKSTIDQMLTIVNRDNEIHYESIDLEDYLKGTEELYKHRMMVVVGKYTVDVIKGRGNITTNHIKELIKHIEGFSFDDSVVFDAYNDEFMINHYTTMVSRTSFYNTHINKVLGGGLLNKSLNIVLGGTHTGKTRLMISLACDYLRAHKNNKALYITLEIPWEQVSTFFDMNFLNLSEREIREMVSSKRGEYIKRRALLKKNYGRLYVKEYEASSITPATIRNLIDEMVKRDEKPGMIFVDYAQLLLPSNGKGLTMFERGDEISKELRSISQKFEIPIWTGAQPKLDADRKNKQGVEGADAYGISGSKGVGENSDMVMNIIQTNNMKNEFKQLLTLPKNRHSGDTYSVLICDIDKDRYKTDIIGTTDSLTQVQEEKDPNDVDHHSNDFSFSKGFAPKF